MAAMTVPTDTMAALAVDGKAPVAAPVSAAAREKVKQLAQEFESLLMGQMLKEMRKSMLSEDEDAGAGFWRRQHDGDDGYGARGGVEPGGRVWPR